MTHPIPDDQAKRLEQLLAGGNKIEAIKVYRELTGVGLKEAKEEVEKLASSMRKEHPEQFAVPTPKESKGCLGTAMVVCIAVFAVAACFALLR